MNVGVKIYMVYALLGILGIMTLYFLYYFITDLNNGESHWLNGRLITASIIGAIADFFDSIGIGSFAITTMLFQVTHFLKSDKKLPGTLNVGHTIPVILQAFLFITAVKTDTLTLFSLIFAATMGSFFGSKFMTKLSEKKVQVIMGIALFLTAILMTLKQIGYLEFLGSENTATSLSGIKLVIGITGNFILGALMTAGVGLYAPCMAMISLLGMDLTIAFPIMMGSCAAIMPISGVEFIKSANYSKTGALGITIGGIFGVIIAFTAVQAINLSMLTWIIILVVIYTGCSYVLKGFKAPRPIQNK